MKAIFWHGSRRFDAAEFAALLARATCVKRSRVRAVYSVDDLFIKHDFRRRAKFKSEFNHARYLESCHIPVVRHLAYGRGSDGNYLVTQQLSPDAVECGLYWQNRIPEPEFLAALVELVNAMRRIKLRHRDLHPGNLLYVPSQKTLALVDVHAVKSPRWYHPYRERELVKIITDFRDNLTDETLLALLAQVGVAKPEKFLREREESELRQLRAEWGKRRRQILSGYPKFTRFDGDFLLDAHAPEAEIRQAVSAPGGERAFLAYYFLRLAHIPVGGVVGFAPRSGQLLVAPEKGATPSEAATADWRRRLKILGISAEVADFQIDSAGRIVYTNLIKAGEALW